MFCNYKGLILLYNTIQFMAKSITLMNIPEDVYKEVIREQGKIKAHYGSQYNLSKTIVKMLRDYIKCRKDNNFKSNEE